MNVFVSKEYEASTLFGFPVTKQVDEMSEAPTSNKSFVFFIALAIFGVSFEICVTYVAEPESAGDYKKRF